MTPERWQQIKEVLQATLERAPDQRTAFLAEVCANDATLQYEVESLLAQHECVASFIESSPLAHQSGAAAPPAVLAAGTRIGSYEIVSLLGRGGMGEVYLAWDVRIGRKAALKILRPELFAQTEQVLRFEQEALTLAQLNHPNIVTVYDIETNASAPFIATEFVEGQTLREKLQRSQPAWREVVEIGIQIASALAAAHAAGVVHRDIKPENIMVRDDRYVKVLDFGIARRTLSPAGAQRESLTQTGKILGTVRYMSPEQARGQKVDVRTDLFSFGVTLYELLTGHPPFTGETQADVTAAILTAEPVALGVLAPDTPTQLQRLVAKALRKKPEERVQTSAQFLAELKQLQSNTATPRAAVGWSASEMEADEFRQPLLSEFDFSPRLQKWFRRHTQGGQAALVMAGGALLAALLSCLVEAGCIRVTLQPQCAGATMTGSVELSFGYVAEPNAAFLYVVIVPLLIMTGFHSLNLAQRTLRLLVAGERLYVVCAGRAELAISPLSVISGWNRRLCRTLFPLFSLLAILAVYGTEYLGRNTMALGWVQALSVQDLTGASLNELQRQGVIGAIPHQLLAQAQQANCGIFVTKVQGGHGAANRTRWQPAFLGFLFLALGLQTAFIIFSFWITTKIMFLFFLVIRALVERPQQTLRIELDFEDKKRRFGLSELDHFYCAIQMLILGASLIFTLGRVTNVAKGTSLLNSGHWLHLGQALLFLSPFLVLGLLLVIPLFVFLRLIETAVGRQLEMIEKERALLRKKPANGLLVLSAKEGELMALLEYKRELALQQRPWPWRNPVYRWLTLMSAVFLFVVPLVIEFTSAIERHNAARFLARVLCAFC